MTRQQQHVSFEGDHDFFRLFCLDEKYTVQVYIGQNVQEVTCAGVRMRPHEHT